jgi:hypothetical protein
MGIAGTDGELLEVVGASLYNGQENTLYWVRRKK